MRNFVGLAAAVSAALALVVTAGAGNTDGQASAGVDTSSAIVQLNGDPLSTYVKTKPASGKKIDFSSNTVKSYRAQLSALRNDFKQWLHANAPAAKVTSEFDIALNAVAVKLNGTSLDTLKAAPQVKYASYEGLYTPTSDDPDISLIKADQAWTANGGAAADAGTGVKVAIVDTGIDIRNPCFSDTGYATANRKGDLTYTNNKVIVARVFQMQTPSRGYTPQALQEHGTHVAGTVACNAGTAASVDGALIPHAISGVAPHALLGNYNVFPGNVGNAHSEDILNALEAAYQDGMDVANMSLGGDSSGINDLLSMGVDDLDQAGMVVAVASGNTGPGFGTVESPGKAARALTAGAATVGHFIATPVVAPSGTYPAASGDFAKVTADFPGTLAVVTGTGANGLNTACSALPAGSLTGKIALITRGSCTFSLKIRNAQDAGAVLVLVGNSVAGDPIAMGLGGIPNEPTVPAYMLSRTDAGALKADDGLSITVKAAKQYFVSHNDDIMAGFSSQGPTDVDFRVKPDVVAPGVNVLSSIPNQFCAAPPCFAFFQGTSMATPHLAGSAAVVLWEHPGWDSAAIRSAIVNTADQGVLKRSSNAALLETNPLITGAGRENLLSAVGATVALDPVSVSFGAVPQGSGQSDTRTIAVTPLGGPVPLSVSIASVGAANGVNYSASLSGTTITVTMSADKGAANGNHAATLKVFSGTTEVAHAVVYTLIKG